nr:phosphopantetheine-binding protein [Methylocucumis oryzae]
MEACLRQHEQINDAVVLVKDQALNDAKLVAYLECVDTDLTAKAVRDYVKAVLPEYMVPNHVVFMAALPVTAHGKADRDALPWPIPQSIPVGAIKPELKSTSLAIAQLLRLAQDVLNLSLSPDDDLFDAGATSFTLVRLIEQIRAASGIAIPIEVVLQQPTLAALSRYLAEHSVEQAINLEQALLALAAEVFSIPGLTEHDDLFDAGATSFTLVRLVERIRQQFNVTIALDAILATPTVAALSAALTTTIQQEKTTPYGLTMVKPSIINLPTFEFEPAFYRRPALASKPSALSQAKLAQLLSLLKQRDVQGKPKYLYSSAGGLNPVQVYVWLKDDAVHDIPAGIYYYHPVMHQLHLISTQHGLEHAFANVDLAADAQFGLFLIAELAAITPIYQGLGQVLSVLEAGYLAQMLQSRQAELELALLPVAVSGFAVIAEAFQLEPSQQFMHCLIGGLADWAQPAPVLDVSLTAFGQVSLAGIESVIGAAGHAVSFPSQQQRDQLHEQHRQLRPCTGTALALDDSPVALEWYGARAAKRDYLDQTIPLSALSGLLSLLRPQSVNLDAYLFTKLTAANSLQFYLYAQEQGVSELASGLYRYDLAAHGLIPVCSQLSQPIKSCYTPFNRKHASQAKAVLFIFANKREPVFAALLEAGAIGQLLLERQAEFGLGLCPIGGLLFDKIRADFTLTPDDELLHSFVIGAVNTPLPAFWPFLQRRALSKSQQQAIGIIGISGVYPGAEDLAEFAQLLQHGKTAFTAIEFNSESDYRRPIAADVTKTFSQHWRFFNGYSEFRCGVI